MKLAHEHRHFLKDLLRCATFSIDSNKSPFMGGGLNSYFLSPFSINSMNSNIPIFLPSFITHKNNKMMQNAVWRSPYSIIYVMNVKL